MPINHVEMHCLCETVHIFCRFHGQAELEELVISRGSNVSYGVPVINRDDRDDGLGFGAGGKGDLLSGLFNRR